MLKKSRISRYKLKKILKYFVEDYTATKTAKLTKLNRNTINRYYTMFRKIIKLLMVKLILQQKNPVQFIGRFQCEYGLKKFVNIYKYNEKLFLFSITDTKPANEENRELTPEEEEEESMLIYKRFEQFYGFTHESYRNQLIELSIRHYYTKDELFEIIYEHLKLPLEQIY